MYLPDLRGEYTALAGYGQCYSFFFLWGANNQTTKVRPESDRMHLPHCRTCLYTQCILGRSLFGAFRHQYFLGAFLPNLVFVHFPGKSNLARCITVHQARTRSLPSRFWRNVRGFSRAFNVKDRDQVSLTAFFEAFPKGWWWKMSGGNRNSH